MILFISFCYLYIFIIYLFYHYLSLNISVYLLFYASMYQYLYLSVRWFWFFLTCLVTAMLQNIELGSNLSLLQWGFSYLPVEVSTVKIIISNWSGVERFRMRCQFTSRCRWLTTSSHWSTNRLRKIINLFPFAITSTILNFNGFMKNTNSCTALMSALDNADCHGLILNWTLVIFLIADEQVTTCPGPGSRRNVQPIAYLLWNRVSWHQRSSQQSVATGVQAELMGIPSHASWDIFISASSHPGRPKNELFWNV